MDQPTDPYMPLKPVSTYRKKKAIENVCSLQKPRYYLKRNQFFTRQYVDCDKVASLIESSFSTKRKLSANQLEPSQPEYKKTKTSSTTAEDSVEPNADQAIQLRLFKIVNDIKSTSDGYDEEGRFIGPQFLEQEYFLSLQEDRTNPFQLCRPWSLLDLLGRMATFKLATWRTKPSGLDASNCARYGWINSASDIIKCYACNAQVESPTEAGQLVDRHGGTCPWRTSFCNEKLYSIPQTTFWNLAEETQNQINLLANHLQDKIPKVEHALDVDQINDLLKKMGRGVDSQALVVLQLFGWFPVIKSHAKLPGPTLRCWMCHRQLGCWNFASFSSENDKPLLCAASQHRRYCPYVKPDEDGKLWPSKWLEKLASCHSIEGKISCNPPWSSFPADSAEHKPFDWESKKQIVSRVQDILGSALKQNKDQESKRGFVSRSARFNTLSSAPYVTSSMLTTSIKSRFAALKHDLDEVIKLCATEDVQ
ncbi:hypothetical protein DSO57_1028724 [Entomophthora muscae]|uniref:Uncharacterized protein n=1 Tax=Entomophthora muscae TaxID=34485 RepID=A0ACC2UB26_9FUNG|nr:hypothetical protein DSO57_1028724 [Entomophthora muscae]